VKYAFIECHKTHWPVSLQCEVPGISPSGYHDHFARRATPEQRKRVSNDALLVHIKAIHAQSKGEYGWPRICKELLVRGIRVGKERVRKRMSLHGIKARGKRKYKATTDSNHALPVRPICCTGRSRPVHPTRRGPATSPIAPPTKAGCIWRW
jgi:putative transposase